MGRSFYSNNDADSYDFSTERSNEIGQLLKSQKAFQEENDAMTKQLKELQVCLNITML